MYSFCRFLLMFMLNPMLDMEYITSCPKRDQRHLSVYLT